MPWTITLSLAYKTYAVTPLYHIYYVIIIHGLPVAYKEYTPPRPYLPPSSLLPTPHPQPITLVVADS